MLKLTGDLIERLSSWFVPRGPGGSWTPTWVGTGTAGAYTYTNQNGYYIQYGGLVYIEARLTISAINTPPVGNMTIGGLPVAASANQPNACVSFGFVSNVNLSANCVQLTGRIAVSASAITLNEVFDNAISTAYPAANFTNVDANVILSCWYRA